MDEKQLLTLCLEVLGKIDNTSGTIIERVDRMASIDANLILLLKKTDQQNANARLQVQAAINKLDTDQARLWNIFSSPEALAGAVPSETIDAARQIKRKLTIATTGRDPASKRKRDDEITLVNIPLLHGGRRPIRANRKLVKLLFMLMGVLAYWLAKKVGIPLHVIE